MSSLTKIFVFLTLIFSIAVSVLVVFTLRSQGNYKDQLNAEARAKLAAQASDQQHTFENVTLRQEKTQLEGQITKLTGDLKAAGDNSNGRIATLEGEKTTLDAKVQALQTALANATAIADSLTKQLAAYHDEINRLSPENVRLVRENAELSRANNELVTAKNFAEQSIRKLQEQIALLQENKSGATTPAADTGTVASLSSQAPAAINAKISSVTPTAGRTLIEMPLGSRDGVRKGTRLMVYRGQNYLADAVVEKAEPDVSVASVDPDSVKKGQTIQAGDMVMTGSK